MIEGYNERGEKVDEFKNIMEMSQALEVSSSVLFENFRMHRQFDTNGVIYHIKDGSSVQDSVFSEDFGYPQLKNMTGRVDYTPDEGNALFEAPVGSILVTPIDDWYQEVADKYKCDTAKEIYNDIAEEQAHAVEQEEAESTLKRIFEEEGFAFNDGIITMGGSFGGPIYGPGHPTFPSPVLPGQDYLKEWNELVERENAERTGTSTNITSDDELGGKDGGEYSANGSSAHYKEAILEYIDKQERCYGTFLAFALCFMQVDKYRDRAGKKAGVPADKDLVKANWYETTTAYLNAKIELYRETEGEDDDRNRAFDEKYGNGRHFYINLPANLLLKLGTEIGFSGDMPLKGLGDIVNEMQKNG